MEVITPAPALALIRECQDRRLEREGIPMFLALVDERPDRVLPRAESGDGRAVVAELDRLRSAVADGQRGGDMGVVISLLQAAAYLDFNESLQP